LVRHGAGGPGRVSFEESLRSAPLGAGGRRPVRLGRFLLPFEAGRVRRFPAYVYIYGKDTLITSGTVWEGNPHQREGAASVRAGSDSVRMYGCSGFR